MHINKFLSATVAMLSIAATDTVCAANIKNQSITIKSIQQKDSANNASITVKNGTVWVFNSEAAALGLTVNGAAERPQKLVVGQNCILNGVRSDTGGANTITTLACN
jgi:tmRNA-binding protein